jgi:PadR family transcriptional regulator, regulatory protein AphA
MPRKRHEPGAPDYAILGLLMLGPRHGYELLPYFSQGGELGLVCTLGTPRLYALLHTLEELGLVQCETSPPSSGPPRKVFSLTDTGTDAFLTWLGQPIRRLRQIRQDFLLKLYFSRRIQDRDTLGLIERQIAACRTVSDELQAAADAEPPESFARLVYQSRQATAEATVTWLEAERAQSFAGVSQGS